MLHKYTLDAKSYRKTSFLFGMNNELNLNYTLYSIFNEIYCGVKNNLPPS